MIKAVRRAGYLGATPEILGLARRSQAFTLRRVRVDGGEPPAAIIGSIARA